MGHSEAPLDSKEAILPLTHSLIGLRWCCCRLPHYCYLPVHCHYRRRSLAPWVL